MKNLVAYVNQCRDEIPFYREKYSSLNRDFQWQEVPFLTPEEFSENADKLVPQSLDLNKTVSFVGSGTSKQVRRTYLTDSDIDRVAQDWRGLFVEGKFLKEGDSILITVPNEEYGSAVLCKHVLPRININPKPAKSIDEHVDVALEGVTAIMTGPTIIRMMIENARKRGMQAHNLRAEKILVGGEDISKENYELMSQIGTQITCMYGLTEAMIPLGVEQAFGEGYKIRKGLNHVELDPSKQNPKQGELIVTPLDREGTRLIRYRTGDFAEKLSNGNIKILGRVDKSAVIGYMTFFLTSELENALLNTGIEDFRIDVTHETAVDTLTFYTKGSIPEEEIVRVVSEQDSEFSEGYQRGYFNVRVKHEPSLETRIGLKSKRIRDLRVCS